MLEIFREFFWLIFPVLGMGMGAFAIWNEFSRQKKALEVLKVYAEKGIEPPASVVAVLTRASSGDRSSRDAADAWPRFAFFLVMAIGFGAVAFWFSRGSVVQSWVFILGFAVPSFVMVALAVRALVTALTSPRANGN